VIASTEGAAMKALIIAIGILMLLLGGANIFLSWMSDFLGGVLLGFGTGVFVIGLFWQKIRLELTRSR
jgi:hypothetical protein